MFWLFLLRKSKRVSSIPLPPPPFIIIAYYYRILLASLTLSILFTLVLDRMTYFSLVFMHHVVPENP